MEIQCLSSCWASFLACFKGPDQRAKENRSEDKPSIVIQNAGAVQESRATFSKRTLPPLPANRPGVYYVAQYDYTARTGEDLSFNAGDTLEALDKSNGDWWLAQALTGVSAHKRGYIPANYVEPVESIHSEP